MIWGVISNSQLYTSIWMSWISNEIQIQLFLGIQHVIWSNSEFQMKFKLPNRPRGNSNSNLLNYGSDNNIVYCEQIRWSGFIITYYFNWNSNRVNIYYQYQVIWIFRWSACWLAERLCHSVTDLLFQFKGGKKYALDIFRKHKKCI